MRVIINHHENSITRQEICIANTTITRFGRLNSRSRIQNHRPRSFFLLAHHTTQPDPSTKPKSPTPNPIPRRPQLSIHRPPPTLHPPPAPLPLAPEAPSPPAADAPIPPPRNASAALAPVQLCLPSIRASPPLAPLR